MTASGKDQLGQWCEPHDLPVKETEMILCSYESPAMDGVIAFILDREKEEYFLVKFEFKENSTDRTTFTRLDAFKQAMQEVYGKNKIDLLADMLGNRLFVLLNATKFNYNPNAVKVCMVLDFDGTILYNKNQRDDQESKYLQDIVGLSQTSFLGYYPGFVDKKCKYKIHDIESKDSVKDFLEFEESNIASRFKRLCRGRNYVKNKITGIDKKLEGGLLCETRNGYLVFNHTGENEKIESYELRLLDKTDLKVLARVSINGMVMPTHASEQFNGNIIVVDCDCHIFLFNQALEEIRCEGAHYFDYAKSVSLGQLPIRPFGEARWFLESPLSEKVKPVIYGYPVAFFSDRRDLVLREKNNVLKNYFNFLINLISIPLLRLVVDYNLLDFCYVIDEVVKEAQLDPPHQVIPIPDGEFGKIRLKRR